MRSDLTYVLDRSGSMADIWSDAFGGLNSFIEEQKKDPDCMFTLVVFDYERLVVIGPAPISDVSLDAVQEYLMPRGSTALLDAVGYTVDEVGARLAALPDHERPEKVAVVIMTDGEENASRSYTKEQVQWMVKHQREVYNWEFFFFGADIDAFKGAENLGIDLNLTFQASKRNKHTMDAAYLGSAAAVTAYRGH